MRRKKVEKQLFSFLMWLPLIFVGVYCLGCVLGCNQNDNPISIINPETFYLEITSFLTASFTGTDIEWIPPVMFEAVFNFCNIMGIPAVYGLIIGFLFLYWITIELIHILYDFIIFLPRVLRSLMERGIND